MASGLQWISRGDHKLRIYGPDSCIKYNSSIDVIRKHASCGEDTHFHQYRLVDHI